jgi:hypothetical protein
LRPPVTCCSRRRTGREIIKAFPTSGAGTPLTLCNGCEIDWTPDGRSLVVRFFGNSASPAETLIVPLGRGVSMPSFPKERFRSKADLAGLPIAQQLSGWVYPSAAGSPYVFARASTQRNIYRIALR